MSTAVRPLPMRSYHFDNLAHIERLEIVVNDPVFHLLAAQLPPIGTTTKPAATSTAGYLFVGVATVVYGGDDRATAELRAHWTSFIRILRKAGIPAPSQPLTAQHFRDFRDKFLVRKFGSVEAANEVLKEALRAAALGQAKDLGLLHGHEWTVGDSSNGWFDVPRERVLIADGTWFYEMYEKTPPDMNQRKKKRKNKRAGSKRQIRLTRSKQGRRRTTPDADYQGKAHGYSHAILSVRGDDRHRSIVLDLARCPKGHEMGVVTESLVRLRDRLPDEDMAFVYDGAMRGKHHKQLREELGLLTINEAPGHDGCAYRQYEGTQVPKSSTRLRDLAFTTSSGETCMQRVEVLAGQLFRTEPSALRGRRQRQQPLDHVAVRRFDTDGTYRWEVDVEFTCTEHHEVHRATIDPNSTMGGIALAEQLCAVPPNHERFRALYGVRNFAESLNQYLKGTIMHTERARSTNGHRHELDLIFAMLTSNAIAWAEHGSSRYAALPGR